MFKKMIKEVNVRDAVILFVGYQAVSFTRRYLEWRYRNEIYKLSKDLRMKLKKEDDTEIKRRAYHGDFENN